MDKYEEQTDDFELLFESVTNNIEELERKEMIMKYTTKDFNEKIF